MNPSLGFYKGRVAFFCALYYLKVTVRAILYFHQLWYNILYYESTYRLWSLDGEIVKITREDVANVALLSRLEFGESELETFTGQLDAILEYADVLNKLNVDNVEPTAHVLPLKNVMRADEAKPSLPRELALANAPEQEDGYFKVPKIMEG